MKIEMVDPAQLTPYENNPRANDDAVPAVKASIAEFGFRNPILAKPDGEVIAGHTRLKAALELGLKEVPVIYCGDLTDEQCRALRLADNKTGELAEWILPMLDVELSEIESIDMSEFGFEMPEVDLGDSFGMGMGDGSEDDVPDADEVEPTVKRGQVWRLGDHVLMCGDSTSKEDVGRLMGGEKALMMFTDPPYNVALGDKNEALNRMDGGERIEKPIANDQYESDEAISEALWLPAFTNAREVADPYCSYYMTMPQGGTHMMMMMMMMKSGWQVKHELIWVKNNHVLSRADYNYQHEPILFGWNEKHRFYGGGEFQNSTWAIPRPNNSDLHPTMKPVALVTNALLNSSVKGDIVLDPFGGSGTTLIACEQTGRRCRMMELDPRYCDVIIRRWEDLTGRKAELVEGPRCLSPSPSARGPWPTASSRASSSASWSWRASSQGSSSPRRWGDGGNPHRDRLHARRLRRERAGRRRGRPRGGMDREEAEGMTDLLKELDSAMKSFEGLQLALLRAEKVAREENGFVADGLFAMRYTATLMMRQVLDFLYVEKRRAKEEDE